MSDDFHTLVNVLILISGMILPPLTFSFAAQNSSRIFFFANRNFLRNLSRFFSLPPQAEVLANVYTIQKSQIQQQQKVIWYPKAKKYIDNEAEESENNANQTIDILYTESSTNNAIYR